MQSLKSIVYLEDVDNQEVSVLILKLDESLNDGLGSTLLALRLLPCSLSLHFCCLVSFQSESIWQPTPCLVWLGIDFSSRNISIPPERISTAEHVSPLSMLNTHFLLLENWPVLWGILFPWVYIWEHHPYHDQIFPFLKFYLALLGIAKFPRSASTLRELCFWQEIIPLFNSRCLVSPHRHYSHVCYSVVSATGCASSKNHFSEDVECWGGP